MTALAAPAAGQCELPRLNASDGGDSDVFGFSVSLSGDALLVGAPQDDDNGIEAGAAYVFRWDGADWVEEQKLLAADGAAGDLFGRAVALSGDVALVGAHRDDDNGTSSGSAYIFRFDGATWVEEDKLVPADGEASDAFGFTVAVDGVVAAIGVPFDDDNDFESGSAYVFLYDGDSWEESTKLFPSDPGIFDEFGTSIAVSGDAVIVGAHLDDDGGSAAGSAYVFRFDGSGWPEEQKLVATDAAESAAFGSGVAMDGSVALVGSRFAGDGDGGAPGAAYIFRFDGGVWTEEQKVGPSGGVTFDEFGFSVALDGEVAVVGARFDDQNGTNAGAVFFFGWDGAEWVENEKVVATDGAAFDQLGRSVTIDGDFAAAGAHLDDGDGLDIGSAYVYDVPVCRCRGDVDRDGEVAFSDVNFVLARWGNAGGPADVNQDGNVDFADILEILPLWGPCP